MPENQDLFKEAIAEAKTIRELALANAKESVSESITPHLKDLLATKLQEMEHDEEEVHEEETHEEEVYEEEDEDAVADEDEPAEDDAEESEDDAEAHDEEGEEMDVEDMSVEDLRNLIRDLISQEMPGADMEMDMEPEMDAEEIPSDDMVGAEDGMGDDEEIDLSELMAELEGLAQEAKHEDEEVHEGEKEEEVHEADEKKEEEVSENEVEEDLKEAIKTINILKKELSEVNLLNSKLLYLNKIMKAQNLTEEEKAKIITTFDKAETVKEAKLIYQTLSENFSPSNKKKTLKEHKSFASKPLGNSTKPVTETPVITEIDEKFKRMQKLAGII